MRTRYFRAGVGTVIYTETGEVAIFKRAQPPVDIWQFQQGGIDKGESPTETLWRELKEEVGVEQADVSLITEFPGWLAYQDLHTETDHTVDRLGQVHKWFFIQMQPDAALDLGNATDDEFSEWKLTTFEEAIERTSDHKKFVYETLHDYFKKHILK